MNVVGGKGQEGRGSRTLRWVVKITVSAALMVFLVRKVSLAELESLLHRIDGAMLAGAVVVFFASTVAGWYQWHLLLRSSGVALPARDTFGFYSVGLFFNNFLPANVGGDAVKVYDVARLGADPYQVIAVTLLDRLLGVFSLCALAAVADLFLRSAEFRTNFTTDLYLSLLQRRPDAAGLQTWVNSSADLFGIRFGILASPEFFLNG